MHHTAAQHFQPTCAAIWLLPGNIHFGRRLGKRKIAWPKTHIKILFEKGFHKCRQGAFQIGKARGFIHQQTFHLMEHWCVCLIGIRAIHFARSNHTKRWFVILHKTHLHARCMGAQQMATRKIEGVVHGARRVMWRKVQRFKIMPVVFDFWALRGLITQARKDFADAL